MSARPRRFSARTRIHGTGGNRTGGRRCAVLPTRGVDRHYPMSAPSQVGTQLEHAATLATRKASDYLSCLQERDGHWCAELTADTTLESDYILFQLWLSPPVDGRWAPETRSLVNKAVVSILERQLPDGGFNIYAGGPAEVSVSVKAYFALKLAGVPLDGEPMHLLRQRILALGGIQAANSYVKVNLSLFDLYPREYCPSIPPAVALLPFDLLYQMSAWTRAIVISLSIVHAANPRRPVPAGFNLDELRSEERRVGKECRSRGSPRR